jgi:hypothetical protein
MASLDKDESQFASYFEQSIKLAFILYDPLIEREKIVQMISTRLSESKIVTAESIKKEMRGKRNTFLIVDDIKTLLSVPLTELKKNIDKYRLIVCTTMNIDKARLNMILEILGNGEFFYLSITERTSIMFHHVSVPQDKYVTAAYKNSKQPTDDMYVKMLLNIHIPPSCSDHKTMTTDEFVKKHTTNLRTYSQKLARMQDILEDTSNENHVILTYFKNYAGVALIESYFKDKFEVYTLTGDVVDRQLVIDSFNESKTNGKLFVANVELPKKADMRLLNVTHIHVFDFGGTGEKMERMLSSVYKASNYDEECSMSIVYYVSKLGDDSVQTFEKEYFDVDMLKYASYNAMFNWVADHAKTITVTHKGLEIM